MRSSRRAFTLVEILLVTTLIAGISLAVFSCLINGLRLWDRSRVLMIEEDAAFFFDRFSSDVRNSFPFSTLAMVGAEGTLAFPTIVMTGSDRAGSRSAEVLSDGIGMVQYVFSISTGELSRLQANYSQGLRGSWGEPRPMIKGLKRVRFKYFSTAGDYRLSQDPGDPFPAGVEVELLFMNGSNEKFLRRFVPVPAGLK